MNSKIISVRISQTAVDLADRLAHEHGMSRSKLVEYLIEQSGVREERSRDAIRAIRHSKRPRP